MMPNTKLGQFCIEHANWEELLTAEPYCLKIKRDGDYVMFSYSQIYSDFNNPLVREARGIIFKEGEWDRPVCWAFNKFFNYGEPNASELDWSTAFVSEKIDGSLIKVWWDWTGGWHVSTNGTIDAYKAELGNIKYATFGDYFEDTIKKYYNAFDDFVEDFDVDLTYMFELAGPYNRVVIPYEEPELYFIGARNNFTGRERYCTSENQVALGVPKVKLPQQYPLTSLDDCVKLTSKYSWEQEGFVVADALGNRVKIKSPAYVKAHFARNNNVVNRKHLINIILSNEVEEFLCYAAEYTTEIEACKVLMSSYYRLANQMIAICCKARSLNRGEYAALVKTFPRLFHDLLFKNYFGDTSVEEYVSGWTDNKWEDCLAQIEALKSD